MVAELYGPAAQLGEPARMDVTGQERPGQEGNRALPQDNTPRQVNNPDNSKKDQLVQVDLGIVHAQCAAARAVASRIELTSLAADSTFGTAVIVEPTPIGHLNTLGDGLINKTFRGARAKRGNELVNQSLTLSFDPNNLSCLQCPKEHPIVGGGTSQ